MHSNGKKEQATFDMIGDVHGCFDELLALLRKMEYQVNFSKGKFCVSHPSNRKVIFLGDLVDRGPKIKEVLHLAMDMAEAGSAFCAMAAFATTPYCSHRAAVPCTSLAASCTLWA